MEDIKPNEWAFFIAQYKKALIASARTEQTQKTRLEHIQRISKEFSHPLKITPEKWRSFNAKYPHWSAEHRRSIRATLRDFCRTFNMIDPSRYDAPIKVPPPKPRPIPDHLLLKALEKAPPREELILRLAGEAGLRRSEIAKLAHNDISKNDYGTSAKIIGKGGRYRNIPINGKIQYLINRQKVEQPSKWIFPNLITGTHLTPERIGKLASKLLPNPYSLHTLRHRYATKIYHQSQDLLATQQLLGHTNPSITQIYIAPNLEHLHVISRLATL